jgi:predicted methyltransferase
MTRSAELLLTLCLAGALAACGAPEVDSAGEVGAGEPASEPEEEVGEAVDTDLSTLTAVVEAPWRDPAARTRDAARNPAETLDFFEIDPAGTIIEIWPGGGWYADILAPWIAANGGVYIAAWPPVPEGNERAAQFRSRFAARYDGGERGAAQLMDFGPGETSFTQAPPADAILTFRNVHNFMAAGFAEDAFEGFFNALKPGGVLGVVEHRLPADRVQDPRAASGYVQQDYVVALAREAGFEFVAASEINANPQDTADHPFGVWTLPPVARTSAFGEPADPSFERDVFDAIGESDRMTLLFRKPGADREDGAEEPQE